MNALLYDRAKCDLCGKCMDVCPFGALSIDGDSLTVHPECRLCQQCVKACPKNAITLSKKKSVLEVETKEALSSYRGIMVFAEYDGERIHPVAFELLGKGRELAGKVGQSVTCTVIGNNVRRCADELLKYGAHHVLVYDHPYLTEFLPDVYTDVMEDAVKRQKPGTILIGATPLGRSLAPRLAARLRTGLTADCTILDMKPDGSLVQTRPAFGGNVMATIVTPYKRPQMATVRHKVMSPAEMVDCPDGHVTAVNMELSGLVGIISSRLGKEQVVTSRATSRGQSIADADVIVAAGRGLRSPDDIPMLENLAARLGGVVGCTRPLVEKGWFPPSAQIGLSGRTVRPRLFVACGISGAIQHVAGMSESSVIIAINVDKNAPIFDVAHYGIVGDLYQMVPAFLNALS